MSSMRTELAVAVAALAASFGAPTPAPRGRAPKRGRGPLRDRGQEPGCDHKALAERRRGKKRRAW